MIAARDVDNDFLVARDSRIPHSLVHFLHLDDRLINVAVTQRVANGPRRFVFGSFCRRRRVYLTLLGCDGFCR